MSRKPNPNLDPYSGVLPDHTCVDVFESYAKHMLKHLTPERYSGLELRERPDLQDQKKSIGVEVTRSDLQNSLKAQSIYAKLSALADESEREKNIEHLHRLGADVRFGLMLGPTVRDPHETVINSYERKLKKLNGGYSTFAHNELFIMAQIIIDLDTQSEMLERMCNAKECVDTGFDVVWLASGETIYKFDLENSRVEQFYVSREQQFEITMEARKEVVAAEMRAGQEED